MKQTKIIERIDKSKESLKRLLQDRAGAEIISLTVRTQPRVNKKNRQTGMPCPFVVVSKVINLNCILKTDYEKAVNKRRRAEGLPDNFKVSDAAWHVTAPEGPPFVMNGKNPSEQRYLKVRCLRLLETSYWADGKKISKSALSGWLPKKSTPKNQGVQNPIIIRTFKTENIQEIRKSGKIFMVTDAETGEGDIVDVESLEEIEEIEEIRA